MTSYYSATLNSNRLKKCYEVAPLRIKQFLDAEIEHIISKINTEDSVLELGCGYGRVISRLKEKARKVTGIDISEDNIQMAKKDIWSSNSEFYTMNATDLKFPDNSFDMVLCIQNGISSCKVDPIKLIHESLRVTRKGGIVLLSTYSDKIWNERLEWFQIQSDHGLIGEIDYDLTKNGVIECKDGFKAITYSEKDFIDLVSIFDVQSSIYKVDNSCLFLEMLVI